jgi:hypothetical protein
MKIAFLISCLEPGRDGVGDYTAHLAEECRRLGHSASLLALNDPFASHAIEAPGLLRLPASQPWSKRATRASAWIKHFAPDFVSLQFVCYGYHPRGLDLRLAARLHEMIGDHPVQIMFHELWIGAEKGSPLKSRLTGAIQRHGVLDVIRRLGTKVVHTSNPAYRALLQHRGVAAELLPLFGSIPLLQTGTVPPADAGKNRRFGIFGTLHPVWPPEPLFTQLRQLGGKQTILHIGHPGSGAVLWEKMTREYADDFEFHAAGAQSPEKIAELFATLDFGIATTPWEIIGKSASTAAMLEHGLPVIVNRDDVHYPGWKAEGYSPLLIKMGEDLPGRLAEIRRAAPCRILPDVARQFLDDLERTA